MLVACLASGCATIVNGTTQTIAVDTEPDGVDVFVNGELTATTPAEIELARNQDHVITLRKPGYEPQDVPVVKTIGGAVFGNILLGGLIGWAVDANSGAQYDLVPDAITATLRRRDKENAVSRRDDRVSVGIEKLKRLDEELEAGSISDEAYTTERAAIIAEYLGDEYPPPATVE